MTGRRARLSGLADNGPGLFVVPGGDVARVAEDAFVGPFAEGDLGDELGARRVRTRPRAALASDVAMEVGNSLNCNASTCVK
jgi:hypothetical protein